MVHESSANYSTDLMSREQALDYIRRQLLLELPKWQRLYYEALLPIAQQ